MRLRVLIYLVIGVFCHKILAHKADSPHHAVQVLSPNRNHSFALEAKELKQILEADAIRDRHVVVFSIAGAFRQGKSFLLNFFLKYLDAQVRSPTKSCFLLI